MSRLVVQVERSAPLLLPDGHRAAPARTSGFPAVLETPTGGVVAAIPLAAGEAHDRGGMRSITDLAGRLESGGRWRVTEVAWMPPADVRRLRAVRPSHGGRTHVAVRGEQSSVCGRVPASGGQEPACSVDCVRCLRSSVVTRLHDDQLQRYPVLVELAGELIAGASARLWQRMAARDPDRLPELLDSMAGAIACGFPGAPQVDRVLVLVHRHQEVASSAVVRWAAAEMQRRVQQLLPSALRSRPTEIDWDVYPQLVSFVELAGPAESAEVLVRLLQLHGPAPAYEPLIARVARDAGDEVSEEVDHWRRIQAVAGALAGGRR